MYVVGIGPGSPGLVTPDAAAALEASDVVVGYRGYLERIAERLEGKDVVGRDLGEEVERARLALELAGSGKAVALVSSGDAGVYGMAGVAWELAAKQDEPPEIVVVPGVTAAVAAASRLGAPLAHDWACISLSDLLTPWESIRDRVRAAAEADFVLVFYNPMSRSRTWQLGKASEILLDHRGPETPVGLVEDAGRPGEHVDVIRLGDLENTKVSMFTTVIVGNSETFVTSRGSMVTPRIYRAKERARAIEGSDDPGRRIMMESLAIIDRELGSKPADPGERAIVRRMIHGSADFDFAANVRFGPGAIDAAIAVFRRGSALVADVRMLRAGIVSALADRLGVRVVCGLDRRAVNGLTRSATGIRRSASRLGDGVVVAIGNAPTALMETIRLIEVEGWRPACVVGMPVGFVGVEESKQRLMEQQHVPFITCLGRKGGTAVTASAINALLELAGPGP